MSVVESRVCKKGALRLPCDCGGIGSLSVFYSIECAVLVGLLLEVTLQQTFKSNAVASLVTENVVSSTVFSISTKNYTEKKKLLQKLYSLLEIILVI